MSSHMETRFDMYMDSIGERWELARSKHAAASEPNPLVAALMGPAPTRSISSDGPPQDELGREMEEFGLLLAAQMFDADD